MKTVLEKKGTAYVISFEGRINYEAQDGIRDNLDRLLRGIHENSNLEANYSSGASSTSATTATPIFPERDTQFPFFYSDTPSKPMFPRHVVFNFSRLEFVGSSGITPFLQLLNEFSSRAPLRTSLCNVSSEFRQMLRAVSNPGLWDLFETEDQALYSGPRPRVDQ